LVWRRWSGRHPTGVDRVCLSYLAHFAEHSQAVVHHRRFRRILDKRSSSALFELLAQPPTSLRRDLALRILNAGMRRVERGKGRVYLNVGHTGLDQNGYREWLSGANVRPVYFVHDLIPITHPEFCRDGESERHRARMATVLTSAIGVIGNSKATLHDLAEFARDEDLPVPRSRAAWLGTTHFPETRAAIVTQERPTFVILGTIEARKNHLMLLHVWSRIVRRRGSSAPRLVIIGQRGWECEQVFDLLDRSELLQDAVTEIGHCNDAAIAAHLYSARALLFPSLVEGYGLPLVEALSAGTPVIASDLPVFREIGQGVPDLIDPLDGPAWERAILSYAEDRSPARDAQLQRLAGYRPPTWGDHFAAVEEWLAKL
jgi:glycosyltransferase involved in cell wall biosynthesis